MNYGWICPVCGKGLAPWLSICPCQTLEVKTETTFQFDDTWISCPNCNQCHKLGDPCPKDTGRFTAIYYVH